MIIDNSYVKVVTQWCLYLNEHSPCIMNDSGEVYDKDTVLWEHGTYKLNKRWNHAIWNSPIYQTCGGSKKHAGCGVKIRAGPMRLYPKSSKANETFKRLNWLDTMSIN